MISPEKCVIHKRNDNEKKDKCNVKKRYLVFVIKIYGWLFKKKTKKILPNIRQYILDIIYGK